MSSYSISNFDDSSAEQAIAYWTTILYHARKKKLRAFALTRIKHLSAWRNAYKDKGQNSR